MKYSRKEIDRAGFALIGDADPFKRQQASALVEDWRKSHWLVLRELKDELKTHLNNSGIHIEIESHRIKRMQSILEKLRNNKENKMGLGGLQDIGGLRFVFSDMAALKSAIDVIKDYTPKNFELKKISDYIYVEPKESGYRSMHFIYKYKSENIEYDGLQIELQVRTVLQHYWAMAVETASLISGDSLKASVNDGSIWRGFFKLISVIFAKKEGTPIHRDFKKYSEWMLCESYAIYFEGYKLIDKLRALQVTVKHEPNKEIEDGYCVLIIDYNCKEVYFQYYNEEESVIASDVFADMEKNATKDQAILMVSMSKMSELRKAYPSYFLDAKDFLEALDEFDYSCAMMFKDRITV